MDTVFIRIDDKEVLRLLDQLIERGDDLAPVMRQVSGIMHDAVEENFEKEGRPRWPALAESTIIQREKKGYWPGKILQRTGTLASSYHRSYSKFRAVVGTNLKYARIQELGGEAGRGHKVTIKSRPVLVLPGSSLDEIKQKIADYIQKGKIE